MSKFFIERPIFASVLAIIIVIAGLVAAKILPIAQYPEIAPPTVTITAAFPGASAETLAKVIGWSGEFVYDTARPDGTPRKLVDTRRINALGWRARIGLEDGLRSAYDWFVANAPEAKVAA